MIHDYYIKRFSSSSRLIDANLYEDCLRTDQEMLNSVFFVDPITGLVEDALSGYLHATTTQEKTLLQGYLNPNGSVSSPNVSDDYLLATLVPRSIQRSSEVDRFFTPIHDIVNNEYERLRQLQTNAKETQKSNIELNNTNSNVNTINNSVE